MAADRKIQIALPDSGHGNGRRCSSRQESRDEQLGKGESWKFASVL